MPINYPLLVSAISAVFAGSASVVSWLNYRVNRRLPNENKLFEEKFRSYRSVVAAMNTAAAVYVECGIELQDLDLTGKALRDAKDELNDELAKAYYLMEDTVYEQTLVLPDEVLAPVDDFIDLFGQEDFLEETAKSAKTDQFEAQLNDRFDAVINAMREDLSLEKLDTGLRKRIGGRQRNRNRPA
jgi:hypothetical protein